MKRAVYGKQPGDYRSDQSRGDVAVPPERSLAVAYTLAIVDKESGAFIGWENVASKRVMEKIGMRYLGRNEEGGHVFTLGREEYLGAG